MLGPALLPKNTPCGHPEDVNRQELAAAVRRARQRVPPEQVGLPVGTKRRVRGLRREELATLAGISVDYVVRIEQARSSQPSEQVLTALARALRLNPDERDQLFHLAGSSPPAPGTIDLHVRPSVLRLIDRFADLPTVVLSAKNDVLAWNTMSTALHGDWSALPPEHRNINRLRFLSPPGEIMHTWGIHTPEDQADGGAHLVMSLRGAAARYPNDPGLQLLLTDLRTSDEFNRLWEQGGASIRRSHRKTFEHKELGRLTLDCDTLHVPDADQSVVVYSAAPGTPEHDQLALLNVLGTQIVSPQPN